MTFTIFISTDIVSRHFLSWWVGDAFLMVDYELILRKARRFMFEECHARSLHAL
jgi:hypothetical protein